MTLENRLRRAFRDVDAFEPSPDLFARVSMSVEEDRLHRRRLWVNAGLVSMAISVSVAFVLASVEGRGGQITIPGWRITLLEIAIGLALVVALAPHLRRFGAAFVSEIFHLSPTTAGHFLKVMDLAYYMAFLGIVLVNADSWPLGTEPSLAVAITEMVDRLGFLLMAMGILHAINLAVLPIAGLLFNSSIRMAARRRAGARAPVESIRARRADRVARWIVVAALGLIALFALSQIVPFLVVALFG